MNHRYILDEFYCITMQRLRTLLESLRTFRTIIDITTYIRIVVRNVIKQIFKVIFKVILFTYRWCQ